MIFIYLKEIIHPNFTLQERFYFCKKGILKYIRSLGDLFLLYNIRIDPSWIIYFLWHFYYDVDDFLMIACEESQKIRDFYQIIAKNKRNLCYGVRKKTAIFVKWLREKWNIRQKKVTYMPKIRLENKKISPPRWWMVTVNLPLYKAGEKFGASYLAI